MKKQVTADERRRAIVEELQTRGYAKRGNLAFEFGVSMRTIDNDLLHLTEEIPFFITKGKGGGVFLQKDFCTERRKQYLTDKQRSVLERLAEGLDSEDKSVVESILTVFARPLRQEARR